MTTRVQCPSAGCAAVFEIQAERLGRNMHCRVCNVRMTARPLAVEAKLVAQQQRVFGQAGAAIERLPLAVLVDNVRSLWNVGSIFRTADACGVEEMKLCGITGCPPRPQIAKTALGAEQVVGWSYRADPLVALDELRAAGYRPVAIEKTERSRPLDEMDWPERTCLVIGNEVAGITPLMLESVSLHAHIPMLGVKDSFNVAVAFGIAAHHASRGLHRNRARASA